ncbi:MAG: SDR family oxidoreductase, partial [Actinomycetota bacterium]|nr:SDR family oxidoreductase [Actinomycetota bacterium]
MDFGLGGAIALVTGGTRGVGRGISEVLVEAGATVIMCGRREPDDSVAGAHFVSCDVRDAEQVGAAMTTIIERYGRLDILVNNAGGSPSTPTAEASPRFHAKIVELNLLAPLIVAQAANAVMQQQAAGGAIVMISSVSGHRPSPGTAAYGAAKAGLDNLTATLAMEWAPKVRVNSVVAGLVRTEQAHLHYGDDHAIAAVGATVPLGRLAEPGEIGNCVAFLA